jgi:hypothetical protein
MMARVGTTVRNLSVDRWRVPVPLFIELDYAAVPASDANVRDRWT